MRILHVRESVFSENGESSRLADEFVARLRCDKHAQTQFLRQFLAFIGIADIELVYAEGLAIGPEHRNNSLAAARAELNRLALQTRAA